jgi:hypothetical protein
MKTSKKLLITLISSIFAVTIAMFIDLRVFGVHRSEVFIPTHEKTFELREFEHLRFSQQYHSGRKPNIRLIKSDSNMLKYSLFSDTVVNPFQHAIQGDTFVILSNQEIRYRYTFELFTNQTLKSISVEGAKLGLGGLEQDSICLKIMDGEIYSYKNSGLTSVRIKYVMADQKDATLNLHDTNVDFFHVNMIRSKARLYDDVINLEARIKENSELRVNNFTDVRLSKDASSKLQVY